MNLKKEVEKVKSKEFYIVWLKATLIRCIRTFAFTFVGLLPTSAILKDVEWSFVISSSLFSVLACFFTCITGIPETDEERELKNVMNEKTNVDYENLENI